MSIRMQKIQNDARVTSCNIAENRILFPRLRDILPQMRPEKMYQGILGLFQVSLDIPNYNLPKKQTQLFFSFLFFDILYECVKSK